MGISNCTLKPVKDDPARHFRAAALAFISVPANLPRSCPLEGPKPLLTRYRVGEEEQMADPEDDFDTQVLSDINGRTLVNGASIDPELVSGTLKATPEKCASL